MKKLITLAAVGFVLAVGSAHASDKADAIGKQGTMGLGYPTAEEAKKAGEQAAQRKACRSDAKGKKGAERKAFLKDCMKKPAAATAAPADAAK